MNWMNAELRRRRFLECLAVGAGGAALAGTPWSKAAAQSKGTLTMADIGVGDPGSWDQFSKPSGWGVNLVAIGNAPSAIINVMIAGGGVTTYDMIHIVGGMQKPLAENGLILPVDIDRIPNWSKNDFIKKYVAPGSAGWDYIAYKDKVYGVPTFLQGESICYLPDATKVPIDSFGALFDPKWKGYVALEDNYTTAGYKTAIYMKAAKLADIKNPVDPTPSEFNTVVNYLIEKKKEGQFRVLWTSFEQAVNLMTSKEVYVLDGWEPMVFAVQKQGMKCEYAVPKEGYMLWAMSGYITNNPKRPPERTQAIYDLFNFMLGPWYGARIAATRGYLTNSQAAPYARANPGEFAPGEPEQAAKVEERGLFKFEHGSVWQQRWPTSLQAMEAEWARFKAA